MQDYPVCQRCHKEFEPFFGLAKNTPVNFIKHEDIFGSICYDCLTEDEKVNLMSLVTSFLVSDELKKKMD